MTAPTDDPDRRGWLRRQLRAFARWTLFWLVSLVIAAALFRVGPLLFPGVDFALARPYVDFFLVVGGVVAVLGIGLFLVVDRLD